MTRQTPAPPTAAEQSTWKQRRKQFFRDVIKLFIMAYVQNNVVHRVHDIYIVLTLPLRTWIRSDKQAKSDCLPILANSAVHINYANELEVAVPFHELHSWEPTTMCLFSRLFQNIRYRHVFSLQSKETTVFTLIFHLLVNEFQCRNRFNVLNSTDLTRGWLLALALAVRGQHVGAWGESTLPAVGDRTHTWQPCSVTTSEAISTAEYNFDFR